MLEVIKNFNEYKFKPKGFIRQSHRVRFFEVVFMLKLKKKQLKYLAVKRSLDILLSSGAIIILSPILALAALSVKLDSKGPVLFKQKRVGKDKKLFDIYKFRTMRTDTPKDMPTHMLCEPEQFITKTGRFLRRTSLDELPQLFNILKGQMSMIGPRPALWNQDDLVAERDKYGANDVTPGLTGWAQVNGRDELDIPVKARLDGEYVEKIGLLMDIRCFFKTINSVLTFDGVLEGGTKKEDKGIERNKTIKNKNTRKKRADSNSRDCACVPKIMKKILITGAHSYIGMAVKQWLECADPAEEINTYLIDVLDMQTPGWKKYDFSSYDVVFHAAGIAHADTGHVTLEQKQLYYKVNTDLAVETAQKAKNEGVRQFIFMSSMIVYGGCTDKVITPETKPKPLNYYGDSKWQADKTIRSLEDKSFKVAVMRPPMIYGRGCNGNYPKLAQLAAGIPVFPMVHNRRSMLHIDNFCQLVKLLIDNEESGVFFPQNGEYTNTSRLVQMIADIKGHKIIMIPCMDVPVKWMEKLPGRIGRLINKVFGDSIYEMSMSRYDKGNYQIRSLCESIRLTEENNSENHIMIGGEEL